jgi:hypothetical protein
VKVAGFTCSAEHLKTVARHPLWPSALRLARTVNVLRSLVTAAVPSQILGESGKLRQRRNALLLLGSALHEALDALDRLEPVFASLPSVKVHLSPMRTESDWRQLSESVLKPIRNAVAFHFGLHPLPPAYVGAVSGEVMFAIDDSGASTGSYYQMADDLLTEAAFAEGAFDSARINHLRFLNDTIVYAGYYCRAVDSVLAEVAVALGFTRLQQGGQ